MKRQFIASSLLLIIAQAVSAQDWDRAVSLFNQKQYRPAVREFHAVLRSNPDYWQAWYYIGYSHFQLQGYDDAIDAFQKYISGSGNRQKEQATGYYFIGFSHYQQKRYPDAIAALQKYVALFESLKEKVDPAARAALGRAFIFTDKYSEAVAALTAASAEMKSNANNHYYIGYANHKLNRDDQAIAALNQALAIEPKDVDSLSLLGNIYLARSRQNPGVLKQAIAIGERLLAAQDGEGAWVLLGNAYLADKQFAKAAPLLDKYARAHVDSSGAWFNLGLSLSRSDQWKPAAEALEQTVKLAPTNLAALIELGYVYEADKQFEKALSAYQRAYEASGRRDETARTSIDRVKQRLGRPIT